MSFSHVLFDLGNVLVKIDFDRVFRSWAGSSGRAFEEIKSRYKQDDAYDRHERGEISGAEYHRHVCRILGVQLAYEDFVRGWNAVFGPLIPETFRFIERYHGLARFAAFSNTNKLHYDAWSVAYASELKLFDRVFC
jgi:putative hydrolase of the HAD superfamily